MQIIYLKTKTPVSIGDKIKIDNVTITITQEFIDDNKNMFEVVEIVEGTRYWKYNTTNVFQKFIYNKIYKLNDGKNINDEYAFTDERGNKNGYYKSNTRYFTPSTEQEYLLQIAKEKYPVGTKFKVVHSPHVTCTVKSHDPHKVLFLYRNNKLVINLLTVEEEFGCNSASVYEGGQWAEILKPILTTEEGKELYEGDDFWWINESFNMVKGTVYARINAGSVKFFSTKEACQEYIDKYKEKTLEDYEKMFTASYERSGRSFFVGLIDELKSKFPELYWYKIALLIRDDLNFGWEADWNKTDQVKFVVLKYEEQVIKTNYTHTQFSKLYFKSSETRDKFIKLMGDKINYLF